MFMPFAGPNLEIVTDYIPPRGLVDHWVKVLGGEAYRPNFRGTEKRDAENENYALKMRSLGIPGFLYKIKRQTLIE